MSNHGNRRAWLRAALAATTIVTRLGGRARANEERFPPVRVVTRGPKHHWFGYYDKQQFDSTGRFLLGMQVDFEHRSPRPDDLIRVGMVDLQDGDRWIELGSSKAWNWQQGCMLQWRPGHPHEVVWNDRERDRFVCHILDVKSRERKTIDRAVYALSPDGRSAIACDFRRLGDVRPGYGYNGLADPYADDPQPTRSGIERVDLTTGRSELILSVADIARQGVIPDDQPGLKHYFNHLLFSPDGGRFIGLHRWRYPNGSRLTRLFTATPEGKDVRFVVPNGYASHFIWRDSSHILCQSRRWLGVDSWDNFLFEDREGGKVGQVAPGLLDPSGHVTYLPGLDWVLNDTYPQGPQRLQTPHLVHLPTKRRVDLGRLPSAAAYAGEWRVDTHPRSSPDGKRVCIDSPAGESGRQLHLIDIEGIVG